MTDAPSRLKALRDMATAHYRRGDFQAAERLLEDALKIDPMSAELWSNLGTAQVSAKRFDAA